MLVMLAGRKVQHHKESSSDKVIEIIVGAKAKRRDNTKQTKVFLQVAERNKVIPRQASKAKSEQLAKTI